MGFYCPQDYYQEDIVCNKDFFHGIVILQENKKISVKHDASNYVQLDDRVINNEYGSVTSYSSHEDNVYVETSVDSGHPMRVIKLPSMYDDYIISFRLEINIVSAYIALTEEYEPSSL